MTNGTNPHNLSSLEGKTAIITGGTQGLGETTAHLFADRGAKGLMICGRNGEKGKKVKAALEKKGAKAIFVKADLAKVDDLPQCGSRLWDEPEDAPDIVVIKGGSLDDPVDMAKAIHIWTSRKRFGWNIPESARQFPQEPD